MEKIRPDAPLMAGASLKVGRLVHRAPNHRYLPAFIAGLH